MHSPFDPAARAPIPVDTLLLAYRSGIFPMADAREDREVFWVEPRDRAIIPLDGVRISRSLRKAIRQDRFTVTLDRAFERVIRACAEPRPGHEESWISERIVASYLQLHSAGHAHSLECWSAPHDDPEAAPDLVGGLYGVAFNRVFCGESMFSRADNASKVALAWLVALMRQAGYALLDCQFMTEHLASLGAVELPQPQYLGLVQQAAGPPRSSLHEALAHFVQGEPGHSPGKLIAQSLTQTS
ncbi:leucyl/phenylalanyl-tRNA--protein transferase [Erythrobacter sp. JK5]|uniref:leucyl/phenylalanyl-tRNA--protein transferase n=1 Tax=Erythrobacter sp. JK5 TaxID=2829500 RepID=UPI001BA8C9FA|nr:leucyl/phenylalanyl-tRNA--protein transferase [Erythrobacter sp. JK5]QUL36825.1 leucyl/phenylalanyl-tRNA--protein transferase [Erythrobacter sp. JK5]